MKHKKYPFLTAALLALAAILALSACTSADPGLSEQDSPQIATVIQAELESAPTDMDDEEPMPTGPTPDEEAVLPGPEIIITLMQPVYRVELQNQDAVPTLGVPGDDEHDEILLLVQIEGIDEGQDPDGIEIRFAINGQELGKTITLQEQVGDQTYWALDLFPMPFDAAEHEFIKLEAWVILPSGREIRHVVDEVELANCGWWASLSGGKSGEIKGGLTFPTATFTGATAEELAQLVRAGYLDPTSEEDSEIPSADEFARAPESYMLGSRQTFPYMQIIPGQAAIAMLDLNVLSFGEQVSVNMVVNDEVRKDGTFSTDLIEMTTFSNFIANGELYWHVDSLCSLDVIIEFGRNPYPESMVPVGLP